MLTDAQLQVLEKQATKPGEAGAGAKEIYELARMGVWARDSVIPFLKTLPESPAVTKTIQACPYKPGVTA